MNIDQKNYKAINYEDTGIRYMGIEIREFRSGYIDSVYEIQREAYKPLYEKYQDDETNPYKESKDAVLGKYLREGTYGYIIEKDGVPVGAVRIITYSENHSAKISALCVLPRYQGQGIAQAALTRIEKLHITVNRWFLDTLSEEAGCCHMYEKLGYTRTGRTEKINDKLTLVFYEKQLQDYSGGNDKELLSGTNGR